VKIEQTVMRHESWAIWTGPHRKVLGILRSLYYISFFLIGSLNLMIACKVIKMTSVQHTAQVSGGIIQQCLFILKDRWRDFPHSFPDRWHFTNPWWTL